MWRSGTILGGGDSLLRLPDDHVERNYVGVGVQWEGYEKWKLSRGLLRGAYAHLKNTNHILRERYILSSFCKLIYTMALVRLQIGNRLCQKIHRHLNISDP